MSSAAYLEAADLEIAVLSYACASSLQLPALLAVPTTGEEENDP